MPKSLSLSLSLSRFLVLGFREVWTVAVEKKKEEVDANPVHLMEFDGEDALGRASVRRSSSSNSTSSSRISRCWMLDAAFLSFLFADVCVLCADVGWCPLMIPIMDIINATAMSYASLGRIVCYPNGFYSLCKRVLLQHR